MCSDVGHRACPRRGFPIRTSSDHSSVASSSRLIAGSYVLHRLLVPRHPPYALTNLTTDTKDARVHYAVLKQRAAPTHTRRPTPPTGERYATSRPAKTTPTPNPPTIRGTSARVPSEPQQRVPTPTPTTTPSTPTHEPAPPRGPTHTRAVLARRNHGNRIVDVPPTSNHSQNTRPGHGPGPTHPHRDRQARRSLERR